MATAKPTQEFVPIKEVRDGVVILKDGSFRAVVMVSSLNFALKSEDMQQAIILQFQNFLNSLDFSIQIFVESRRLDIRPYLALLEDRYKAQTSDLMKVQTREYIGFIKAFTESTSIMSKTFFVVTPYSPAIISRTKEGGLSSLLSKLPLPKKAVAPATEVAAFEEYRAQILERVAVVEQGLTRCGLRTALLGTEEIIELFYKIFNPGETEKPIQQSTQYAT